MRGAHSPSIVRGAMLEGLRSVHGGATSVGGPGGCGQHGALEGVQRSLRGDERLLAFLRHPHHHHSTESCGASLQRELHPRTHSVTCLLSWEHHWATLSLSQHIWSGSRRNTECCWKNCASAWANYLLRVVRPELVRFFAQSHDAGL